MSNYKHLMNPPTHYFSYVIKVWPLMKKQTKLVNLPCKIHFDLCHWVRITIHRKSFWFQGFKTEIKFQAWISCVGNWFNFFIPIWKHWWIQNNNFTPTNPIFQVQKAFMRIKREMVEIQPTEYSGYASNFCQKPFFDKQISWIWKSSFF